MTPPLLTPPPLCRFDAYVSGDVKTVIAANNYQTSESQSWGAPAVLFNGVIFSQLFTVADIPMHVSVVGVVNANWSVVTTESMSLDGSITSEGSVKYVAWSGVVSQGSFWTCYSRAVSFPSPTR